MSTTRHNIGGDNPEPIEKKTESIQPAAETFYSFGHSHFLWSDRATCWAASLQASVWPFQQMTESKVDN
jgi:hypothetical protein